MAACVTKNTPPTLRSTAARRLAKNSPPDCFCPATQCRSLGFISWLLVNNSIFLYLKSKDPCKGTGLLKSKQIDCYLAANFALTSI